MQVVIETGGHWPDDVGRILRDLPEWFGMEDANAAYVESARSLTNLVAIHRDEVVGVCLIRRHGARSAEIDLLAVPRAHHHRGIGRQLVERAATDLRSDGVRLLQVKTFGPSGDSEPYERTRAFYDAMGFLPLEERDDLWGPGNPCLICVRPLLPAEPALGW